MEGVGMEPDDLYGLPLDRFVPERGALAKALRTAGRREDATRVAGMRKPSVAAWAVNQTVRTQRRGVKTLFSAGDALREAQANVLAGRGDGRALRTAGERERAAVERLVDAARGLLTSHGLTLSNTVIDRVADTLHAAALDEDAREQVREGRLERELRHVGLGLGESESKSRARASATRAPAPTPRRQRRPDRPVVERRSESERATREQAAARKAARSAEASARRRVERTGHALRAAQERRERAVEALDAADQTLAASHAEAEAAAEVQRRARAELENA